MAETEEYPPLEPEGDDSERVEAEGVKSIESFAFVDTATLDGLDALTLETANDAVNAVVADAQAAGRQLTPHFALREFHCHDGTHVPRRAVPALLSLCREVLEPVRAQFGVCIVNSGHRSRAYNESVGGVPNSQHIYGLTPSSVAADVTFATGSPAAWARAADGALQGGGGLGTYGSFIHVDNRSDRARW